MTESRTYRLNPVCVEAIRDIQIKIKKQDGFNLPFPEASRWLGEKYIRGQLDRISDSEIRNFYRKKRKWKVRGIRCI